MQQPANDPTFEDEPFWIFEMPWSKTVYPEYWTDVNISFCPSAAMYAYEFSNIDDLIDCDTIVGGVVRGVWCGGSDWDPLERVPGNPGYGALDPRMFTPGSGYWYCGWAAAEHPDVSVSFKAYRGAYEDSHMMEHGFPIFDEDLDLSHISGSFAGYVADLTSFYSAHPNIVNYPYPAVPLGNGRSPNGTIYRIREGIERFTITDINNPAASAKAQSELPVMWDWAILDWGFISPGTFNHVPGGANILYMDGHVEFMRYPSDDAPLHPVCMAEIF
jgi:prepilin-type processing-associated H-X9-DG protein